ncbi:hypothetical protein MTR67_033521 [Solanum verrucosum]|uniref:Uncharacterized protein n=1 Tax=Solanum verrucosum TaxID=315347 RepID=A0AAF0U6L7_SOLVR|nr:hypothetical protein MTR67_033521 [Solanum verrucosum]
MMNLKVQIIYFLNAPIPKHYGHQY